MSEIFCPQCQWKPQSSDVWSCDPNCGHAWHTFDTRGQCPKCRKQWRQTQCLQCAQWSPHVDWYHQDAGESARLERLVESEKTGARPYKMAVAS